MQFISKSPIAIAEIHPSMAGMSRQTRHCAGRKIEGFGKSPGLKPAMQSLQWSKENEKVLGVPRAASRGLAACYGKEWGPQKIQFEMAAPRELIIDVVGQSISGQGSGNRVIPTVPDTLTQYKQYEMNHITLQIQASTEIGRKAWLFAKLQPGRARKRMNQWTQPTGSTFLPSPVKSVKV